MITTTTMSSAQPGYHSRAASEARRESHSLKLVKVSILRGMSSIGRAAGQTFKALRVRNYRLYFFGQ